MAAGILSFRIGLIATALTIGGWSAAQGQLVYRADAQVASRYLWRGMRRTDRSVFQSDVALGFQRGLHSLTAGAWLNSELHNARPGGVSDRPVGHWGPSETDLWLQYSGGAGHLRWSAGAIEYRLTTPGADPRATEVYGEVLSESGRWIPRIGLWHRTGRSGATYLETGFSFLHFVNPFTGPYATWTTTALAGLQLTQRNTMVPADWLPAPAGKGLTHVGLSSIIRLSKSIGPVAGFVSFGLYLQASRDSVLRLRSSSAATNRLLHLWAPVEFGVSIPLRRPE
jgi:hypothetical protein